MYPSNATTTMMSFISIHKKTPKPPPCFELENDQCAVQDKRYH